MAVRGGDARPVALVSDAAAAGATGAGLRAYFRVRVSRALPADVVFPVAGRGSLAGFVAKGPLSLARALDAVPRFGAVLVCVLVNDDESRLWFARAQERANECPGAVLTLPVEDGPAGAAHVLAAIRNAYAMSVFR